MFVNYITLTKHIDKYFQTGIVCLRTISFLGAFWELSGSSLGARCSCGYSWFNNVYDIETMSTQSSKQCPNCKRWLTTQKSFKHHIRHCRRTICEEPLNDIGSSTAIPLLSNYTPGVELNVLQQSNLNESYKDEYEDIEQIEDFVASTFDSDSWVTMMKNLRKHGWQYFISLMSNLNDGSDKISDHIEWSSHKAQSKLSPVWWDLPAFPLVHLLS